MTEPQLTIGIPHLDRSNTLRRAIESCIRQTVPVHIIVADQGGTQATADVCSEYPVEHILTKANSLWENWDAAARACRTPFFAWLQDDDIIAPAVMRKNGSLVVGTGYAARCLLAFDMFPDALHWQARLYCGVCPADGEIDDIMAAPWAQSFPWVMVPALRQLPMQWPGQIIAPVSYLTSWAMSPAVAFRCGPEFTRALDCMPDDAALMAERLILASMGIQGPWIADPVLAGYWIHHGGNESYKQHVDQERQKVVMTEHLDECLDRTDWQDIFAQWCVTMNPVQVLGFANNFECGESRYADELKRIMLTSLRGRVEGCDPPKGHKARDNAPATEHAELVWN